MNESKTRFLIKPTGDERFIAIMTKEDKTFKGLPKEIQSMLVAKKEQFSGKKGTSLLLTTLTGDDFFIIGLGTRVDADEVRKASAVAAKKARECHALNYLLDLDSAGAGKHAQAAAEGTILGLYRYDEYKKAAPEDPKDPSAVTIKAKLPSPVLSKALERGRIIAEGVCLVRDLVNRPASDKPPAAIAKIAQELGKKYGFDVKVLGEKELADLGMGCLLAVGRGSSDESKMVIMDLNKNAKERPVALAGKGVTFDTGGIQLKENKPIDHMVDMKLDMGGAATVIAIMVTLARLGHKGRMVGAVGLVENMIGPDSFKPLDILRAHNGKTIEVIHTDAEGRLVLADLLSYLDQEYHPKAMMDLATLTGASVYAVGYRTTPIIGTDQKIIDRIKLASMTTDELVWQLPLRQHYRAMMKGTVTDLRNLGRSPSSYGGPGTITAAAFLSEFVDKKTPWVHFDIAWTAYSFEETEYVPLGGTGWGVRLFAELLEGKKGKG